jgi:hypothetical protein
LITASPQLAAGEADMMLRKPFGIDTLLKAVEMLKKLRSMPLRR